LDRWSDIFFVETFPFFKRKPLYFPASSFFSRHLQKYTGSNLDDLVKSLLKRHPGESRGPEPMEINGFRLSPEGRNLLEFDFLRDHQFFSKRVQAGDYREADYFRIHP